MLFNSLHYLIFFPSFVGLYYLIPKNWRWALLLLGSYFFYMCWKVEYIGLILLSTGIDYLCAQKIEKDPARKKGWLGLSLVTNLGILTTFKYFNFFIDQVEHVAQFLGIDWVSPHLNVLLPVGISFYTFQTLSYTIDVYRGETRASRHLGMFAIYVAYFPQLVAGPIERSRRLLSQIENPFPFSFPALQAGVTLILWGLFKKMVVADRLAPYVVNVYGNVTAHDGPSLLLATYFFAFQIYGDFSGYTDIARGSSLLLGIKLIENFHFPYSSTSIGEFWHRWHVSLSTWFRDYLYIPLGGSRMGRIFNFRNLMLVFLISGLWHGANWTFLVWGGLHGLYLVGEKIKDYYFKDWNMIKNPLIKRLKNQLITFHLVVLAWIFFRANSLGDALYIVKNIFKGWPSDFFSYGKYLLPFTNSNKALGVFLLSVFLIVFMECVQWVARNPHYRERLWQKSPAMQTAAFFVLGYMVLFLGVFNRSSFIYFQF